MLTRIREWWWARQAWKRQGQLNRRERAMLRDRRDKVIDPFEAGWKDSDALYDLSRTDQPPIVLVAAAYELGLLRASEEDKSAGHWNQARNRADTSRA